MTPALSTGGVRVAALYRFFPFSEYASHRSPLLAICQASGLRGTLLLAPEGFNGTLAGSSEGLDRLLASLASLPGAAPVDVKFSDASAMPFHRLKVRLKREIVTMGVETIDPRHAAGTYVEPSAWNDLIADPDTIVVDTRNDYEVRLGTFERALDPGTATFRAFPAWIDANCDALKGKRVAMFCTGGIRCEKATAYARAAGIADVFHLKGGILKYLEEVPAADSRWRGECFVFDERVSVGHGLAEGDAALCRACRMPLTVNDRASPKYRLGVSCPHCLDLRSDADRDRYAERQRQVERAADEGRPKPVGAPVDCGGGPSL